MKLAKRIIVAVLAIALLASVFALSSVAEKEREYDYRLGSIAEAEQILEYYALEEYLADNYEAGTWNEECIKITKASGKTPTYVVEADPLNPDNKVLKATLPTTRTAVGYEREASTGELLTDKLIVSARVYFYESATTGLNFTLNAGLQSEIDSSSRYFDIVSIDMKTGNITYSGWDDSKQIMQAGKYTYEGWKATTGEWYDILITFNAEADYYNFVVKSVPTDNSEAVVLADTGNIAIKGATGMAGFNLSVKHSARNVDASFAFDNVEIYEGTTTRSPSFKGENTKIHVEDLVAFYAEEDTDAATKLRIADVLYELYVTYGVDVSYNGEVAALPAMYETLAAELISRVENINEELNYAGRTDWIKEIEKYDNKLPDTADLAGTPGLDDLVDEIVEAREGLAAEKAAVLVIKEHSDNFIDFMTNVYDADNKDYVQMQVWIAELADEYTEDNADFYGFDTEKYPYQTRFYSEFDATYGQIPELMVVYNDLLEKFADMTALIEEFIIHVDTLEISASFGDRYASYMQACEIYNDGVIHPGLNNDSHADLKNRIAFYLKAEPSIIAKRDACENFMVLVERASIASYYSVLVEKLDLAVEAFDLIAIDYPNISGYIETYNELRNKRAELETAASNYIAAVDEIEIVGDDFYGKKAAVLAALALKEQGDVLGFPGVSEANMALSAAEADVKFREYSSTTLISLVEQVKATESIEERRALLRLAYEADDNAEIDYEGVAEAKADLRKELSDFAADVKAANASIASACDAAAAIASAVNGISIYNK